MATYQNCNGSDTYSDVTTGATWSTDNSAIASFDSTTKGLFRAHAAGSTTMHASYTGTAYRPNCQPPPCHTPCLTNPVQGSYSCPISVSNSGVPDHLEVASDNYFYWKCIKSGLTIERDIKYDVVDANGSPVSSFNIKEAFSGLTSNTCQNGGPSPSPCTAASYSFTDGLSVECNTVGGSCGFTIAIQQWHWCPSGFLEVAIGTLHNTSVYNNAVTVLGLTVPPEANEITPGTPVYP